VMLLFTVLFISLVAWHAQARAQTPPVSVAIVLAADVSASINNDRFKLQREGYADALRHPAVLAAIRATHHQRIAVTYVEWSSEHNQTVIVPWTIISNEQEAARVSAILYNAPRSSTNMTAVGAAINNALLLLEICPFAADRRVIDVSGDGTTNEGVWPAIPRDRAQQQGVQINGIVIFGDPTPGLEEHYREHVQTVDGFTMVSDNFDVFAYAIINKLIREIM